MNLKSLYTAHILRSAYKRAGIHYSIKPSAKGWRLELEKGQDMEDVNELKRLQLSEAEMQHECLCQRFDLERAKLIKIADALKKEKWPVIYVVLESELTVTSGLLKDTNLSTNFVRGCEQSINEMAALRDFLESFYTNTKRELV